MVLTIYSSSNPTNQVISIVRDSLWFDLVEPHLCSKLRVASYSFNNDDTPPTLVLILAVSGGCDSIALFHSALALTKGDGIFHNRSDRSEDITTPVGNNQRVWLHLDIDNANPKQLTPQRIPCELHVAHFNHEQRGESSGGDEAFVKRICDQNNIPCHSFFWSDEDSSREEANANGDDRLDTTNNANMCFTQDVARNWRRRKLKELLLSLVHTPVAESHPNTTSRWGAILTAHHRDDADETILLKLLRGAHLTNIRGMDARSDAFKISLEDGSSSLGYFAKPMLQIRKRHIVNYLTSNSLEWREDDSNNSSKYKRNKIRNELIPLLSDIAGGDTALQKRLINLEQQSRDISHYLSERAQDYLESMPSNSTFFLTSNTEFDLAQEESLHTWMIDQSQRELHVSYDKMLKIRDQIRNHSDRLQWKMDMGDNWTLSRNGCILVISKGDWRDQPSNSDVNPWFVCVGHDATDMSHLECDPTDKLHFACWLPTSVETSTIKIEQAKDCIGVTFLPPWRKEKSELKLKDFLRGQRVPLHRRNESNILCFSDNTGKRHALAVHLENTDEWIMNANFCRKTEETPEEWIVNAVLLF